MRAGVATIACAGQDIADQKQPGSRRDWPRPGCRRARVTVSMESADRDAAHRTLRIAETAISCHVRDERGRQGRDTSRDCDQKESCALAKTEAPLPAGTVDAPIPRVCVCVMMNHPFPANLPLLREIYRDRFSAVRFLIPFERMPDEDVITVYRGSYTHAGYLTDAHHLLAGIDCDYFLVIHDDVLLNPGISERTFQDIFGLGRDDGFIASVGTTPAELNQDVWWYGLVAKMLFPKSLLFGSGIEPANLVKYLPDADRLREKLEAAGLVPGVATRIRPDLVREDQMLCPPSRMMLHGLYMPLAAPAAQAGVEEQSREAAQRLAQAMLEAQRIAPAAAGRQVDADGVVPLPFPTVGSSYFTDLYILPKTALDEFCHYVGVASAANLFVEMLAPTLLHACCARVRTAAELGLDLAGFLGRRPLHWFEHPRALAMHPFKLSPLKEAQEQRLFVEFLRTIGSGRPLPRDTVARVGFGTRLAEMVGHASAGADASGWHSPDPEYIWSCDHEATIPIVVHDPVSTRLRLLAPLHPKVPRLTGRILFNDGERIEFAADAPNALISLDLPPLRPDADGIARIKIVADRLLRPCDLDDTNSDSRPLGFAFLGMSRPAPEPEAAAAEG